MENETAIIEKAKRGDKDAFGRLYKHYFPRIYRYCKANIYRDDLAADICQETFLKTWKALPTFTLKNGGTFQAYIYRIARNVIIDLSRKKKEFSLEFYEEIETEDDLVEKMARTENIDKVKHMLAKLPEKDRQILILRYFEDMSHKETAKVIGIREGALRVRTTRLLKKVKRMITDEK
jgi:RNA polymerase sigma-70 factor (ECF subfamily)